MEQVNMLDEVRNVVLIGMPGAGKSTQGIVLAKILGYEFMDGDHVIQEQTGKALSAIIEEVGPEGFIKTEGQILGSITTQTGTVISTGGSAVYSEEGMAGLAKQGTIVYLDLAYEELERRLGDLVERGVVMKNGTGTSLKDLFDERAPLYQKYAQITVDVNNIGITDAARKIAAALEEFWAQN